MATRKTVTTDYSKYDTYGEPITYLNNDTYKAYAEKLEADTEYRTIYAKEAKFFGIENNPSFIEEKEGKTYCTSQEFTSGLKTVMTSLETDASRDELIECMGGPTKTEFLIGYPTSTEVRKVVINKTGLIGALQALDLSGKAITCDENRPQAESLPTYIKAFTMNATSERRKDKIKLLIRNNRVIGVHSNLYTPLPFKDLIEGMEKTFAKAFASFKVAFASASNSFIEMVYEITEPLLEQRVKNLFANSRFETWQIGIHFATSDTSKQQCAAVCLCLYNGNAYIPLSNIFELKHIGKRNVVDDFSLTTDKCCMAMSDLLNKVQKISTINVEHLPDFIRYVAYTIGFDRETVKDYTQYIPLKGTVYNAYLALLEISQMQLAKKSHSPEMTYRVMTMPNALLAFEDYKKFDIPFEWVATTKGSVTNGTIQTS